ncbi:MAG: hybrid sensor histidine kinase/response regulator [Phycisphaerales bacterium JB039]
MLRTGSNSGRRRLPGLRNLLGGRRGAASETAQAEAAARVEALRAARDELHGPLMSLASAAESLRAMDDPAGPRGAVTAAAMGRTTRRMLTSLDEMLDLALIEAGRLEVANVDCSPASILAEVVSLAAPMAEEHGARFETLHRGTVPARIRTDPARLRQILLIMARWASAAPAHDPVQLEVAFEAAPEGRLRFSLRGFCGASGPGLQLAGKLATLLGGRLEQPGAEAGDAARLTIPTGPVEGVAMVGAAQQAPAPATPEPTAEEGALERRILLVEQEADTQRRIASLLREAGAEVEIEDNGADGCDRALVAASAGRPFDMILMDLRLPALDGYEAARRLRREGYEGSIVALGAGEVEPDKAACLEAGCDDLLLTPVSRQSLVSACGRWSRRRLITGAA